VKLTVKIVNNELLVSVADSGVGIEDTRAIFAAYNQEGGLESQSQGTGLGLSIVETLCKKLNIGLTLTSSVNAGTRFTLNMGKIHEFKSPKPENQQISHSAKVMKLTLLSQKHC
jgi:signal transduction histidine kinase